MLISCLQFTSLGNNHFFKESRLIFKDPEDPENPSPEPATPEAITTEEKEEQMVHGTRTDILGIKGEQPYPLGEQFDLDKEVAEGHISERAAEFLRQWPVAKEAMEALYQYDAYSYIHTAQMLNEGHILIDKDIEAMRSIVMAERKENTDRRFNFPEEKFGTVLAGAITLHDWGKRKVDSAVLNYPQRLNGSMKEEMQKHPMATLQFIISKIINGAEDKEQEEIRTALAEILDQEEWPREKLLLQMAYMAVSHHCYAKSKKEYRDYPPQEDIEKVLPDYKKWLNSSGEEQAMILALFDINDALRSSRSYKNAITDEAKIKGILNGELFMDEEHRGKYKRIIELLATHWIEMPGSADYTEKRKKKEKETKK